MTEGHSEQNKELLLRSDEVTGYVVGNAISEDNKVSICTEMHEDESEMELTGPEHYVHVCQGKESGHLLWALSSHQQTLNRRVIHSPDLLFIKIT